MVLSDYVLVGKICLQLVYIFTMIMGPGCLLGLSETKLSEYQQSTNSCL